MCAAVGRLTAHGLAGVDLLSHEELLQLPDVHPGLGHDVRVPALRRTAVLGGVITWRDEWRTRAVDYCGCNYTTKLEDGEQ